MNKAKEIIQDFSNAFAALGDTVTHPTFRRIAGELVALMLMVVTAAAAFMLVAMILMIIFN